MKRIFKYLVPLTLLALTLMMVGCGDTNTTTGTTAASNFDFSKTGTLQGALFDAVTGKRIADSNTKIVMVRGADIIQVSRYYSSATDIARGEYAFTGVPVSVFDGNATYRVIVEAPGYQRFEAEASSAIAGSAGSTYDTVYNRIGNIYLFPTGVTAADYSVTVRYNTKAVPGATVQLQQNATNNNAIAEIGAANRLLPTSGLLPTISATTDANGVATFSGTDLVLGGQYTAVALPVKTPVADGAIQLAATFGGTFTEGAAGIGTASAISQTINMNDAVSGNNASGLYVVSASNSPSGTLTSTGVLTLTFNEPVILNTVTPTGTTALGFSATLANNITAALNPTTNTAAPSPTKAVISSLSADGKTLTLTPSFSTNPNPTGDYNLSITYGNGTATVSPAARPTQTANLFSLTLNGGTLSGTVNIYGPQP